MNALRHNSRDLLYRTPSGARACGSFVTLRFYAGVPGVRGVVLRLWWQNAEQRLPMRAAGDDLYEYALALPGEPGLLWYYFIVQREGAPDLYYGNAPDGLGGEGCASEGEPPSFQITLYEADYRTPEWMREGVMYQIFCDRFCASRPAAQRPAPQHGYWHANWDDAPVLDLDTPSGDNAAHDFFGGDLRGVLQKLDYLCDLGVRVIYFNPIFRARSNHKYDTGDYETIDPSFGTVEDFRDLCAEAARRGIRVMLDGVFSHTGSDSRYFNREGNYPGPGAYQSPDSPYAAWYRFKHWPHDYDCWWGFQTLPNVCEMEPSYLDYIIRDPQAIAVRWPRCGASGWRLDVADELPMEFIRLMRARLKAESPDLALLGEVWEDASNKVAYGQLRSYCLGDALDSCMNYPLRDALIGFMLERIDARELCRRIEHQQECYPAPFFYSLMNLLGSHDKPRIINVLSGAGEMEPPREQRRALRLKPDAYALGRRRFIAAWRFLCALPGMPCLYYADEAGAQGMADPFCRGTYPWGQEDAALLRDVRDAIRRRNDCDALRTGELRLYAPHPDVVVAARRIQNGRDAFGQPRRDGLCLLALNRAAQPRAIALPADDWLSSPVRALLDPQCAHTLR